MYAVYRKELAAFLSSLIGLVVMALFLVTTAILLWWIPDFSILESNYASLAVFFEQLAPQIFLFLIPAITMRMLAEENQTGTIELLVTRPLSDWQIILGKFWASLTLVGLVLLPTLVYYFSVYQLGATKGNLDTGGIIGSYIGLVCLGAVFCAIGIFASALSSNQIVAFLLAIFLCFISFWMFDLISRLPIFYGRSDDFVQKLGVAYHYNSISRGVIDTRDMIYFVSATLLFLSAAALVMSKRRW